MEYHIELFKLQNYCVKISGSTALQRMKKGRRERERKREKEREREIPGSVRTADGTTDTSAVAQGRAREPKKDMTCSWLTDRAESDRKGNQTNEK